MAKIVDIKPPREKVEKKEITEKEEIVPPPPKRGFKKGWIFLILIFVFVVVYFLLSYLSFVKIELKPKMTDFDFEKELTVDSQVKSLDFSTNVIPGQKVEFEKTISQEFLSSGQKQKEEKATGIIKVFNETTQPQPLIATTRFVSKEGKIFRSIENITVPAAHYEGKNLIPGEVETTVRADQAGEDFNIGPSTFSIPGLQSIPEKYTKIYGKSSQSMTGGAKKTVSVVTEDDLKKAKDSLSDRLRDEGEKLIKEKISESYSFLGGVSKTDILEVSYSATSGQEVEKFNCQLKIKAKSLVSLKKDLEDFIKNYINSANPEKTIWPESLKVEQKLKNFDIDSGKVFLVVTVKAKIYKEIDQVSLKKQIAKIPMQEVKIYLKEQPEIESFKINIFPFWVKTLPENLDKINLEIKLAPSPL